MAKMLDWIFNRGLRAYVKYALRNEREFVSDNTKIKYLYFEAKTSNRLLVLFSAFPAKAQKPTYSYLTKYTRLKINKLYILDDFGHDGRGAYYLGKNREYFIEKAVFELIENIRKSSNIERSNIITTGSSKGGWASLFFTLKYGYGATISGSPQYLLGEFLSRDIYVNIMRYISGAVSDNDRMFLNNLMIKEIDKNSIRPKIYIHFSPYEYHYKDQIIPLIKKLKELNYSYELDLSKYKTHNEVGKSFPGYVKKIINRYYS